MKVLFRKNIKGKGRIDEVKEVPDGYALNFLIPSGSAVRATDELVLQVQAKKQASIQTEQEREAILKTLLAELKKTASVTLTGHGHSKGHLYQGITAQEIAHAIHEQHKIFVSKDFLLGYDKPIKEIGEHAVSIGTKNQSITYQVVVQ